MTKMRFLGVAVALAMAGGGAFTSLQPAHAAQVDASQAAAAPRSETATPVQVWAMNTARQNAAPAASQPSQEPMKVPFANFGQWDEAASEN